MGPSSVAVVKGSFDGVFSSAFGAVGGAADSALGAVGAGFDGCAGPDAGGGFCMSGFFHEREVTLGKGAGARNPNEGTEGGGETGLGALWESGLPMLGSALSRSLRVSRRWSDTAEPLRDGSYSRLSSPVALSGGVACEAGGLSFCGVNCVGGPRVSPCCLVSSREGGSARLG